MNDQLMRAVIAEAIRDAVIIHPKRLWYVEGAERFDLSGPLRLISLRLDVETSPWSPTHSHRVVEAVVETSRGESATLRSRRSFAELLAAAAVEQLGGEVFVSDAKQDVPE